MPLVTADSTTDFFLVLEAAMIWSQEVHSSLGLKTAMHSEYKSKHL
jgi:hypothetical protein